MWSDSRLNPGGRPSPSFLLKYSVWQKTFPLAFYKSQEAAGSELPHAPAAWENKKVLISLSNKESQKDQVLMIGKTLKDLGFTLVGTQGTADFYNANGIKCEVVNKIGGGRPDVVDLIAG